MLIILVVAVLGYYLIKENGGFTQIQKNDSLEKLKERYVNDEIDEEEYLRKKRILEGK